MKKTDEAERKLLSLYDKWFNEVQKNSPDFFTIRIMQEVLKDDS